MPTKHLLSAVMISLTLLLGACATDTTRSTAQTPVNDTTLTSNVTSAVQGVSGVNQGDLDVSVRKGVVTLRGRTQTRTQAQDAIEAARHVPGVLKVDYDINVDEP